MLYNITDMICSGEVSDMSVQTLVVLLVVSECMPFLDRLTSNGILHGVFSFIKSY